MKGSLWASRRGLGERLHCWPKGSRCSPDFEEAGSDSHMPALELKSGEQGRASGGVGKRLGGGAVVPRSMEEKQAGKSSVLG